MVSRHARFSLLAAPALLMLAACAGADAPGELSAAAGGGTAGYVDGAAPQWPGSPYLSYEDRDALGRVSYAEAGNQGEEGIAAVIFTILNRVNSGHFDSTVQGVIDAPNQFEPAARAGGWRYLPPLDPWQTVQFDTILNLILAGRLPDLTNGALFFQNAEIVAARAARGRVSSYLVDFGGTPPVAEIGDHRFYDWRAGINLGARRQRRVEPETYAVYSEPDGAAEASVAAAQEAAADTYTPAQPEVTAEAVAEAQQEPVPSNDVAFALPPESDCTVGVSC